MKMLTILFLLVSVALGQVTTTTPVQNALNIDKSTNISVTFAKHINQTTLNNNTIKIAGSQSGFHPGSIAYDSISKKVSINPNADFRSGEIITVNVTSGVHTVSGSPIVPFSWCFTINVDGAGSEISQTATVALSSAPLSVASSDFNGDGLPDIATANFGGGNGTTVTILKNFGNGNFSVNGTLSAGTGPRSVAAGDVDGDGDIDLCVASFSSNQIYVFKNDGAGNFFTDGPIPLSSYVTWVTLNDFDGDGDIDIAATEYNLNAVIILKNNGTGTFTQTSAVFVQNLPIMVASADIDADGDFDLAVVNASSNTVSILKNDGNGTFTFTFTISVGTEPIHLCMNDLDGDGDNDIAVANGTSQNITILKNDGNGGFFGQSTTVSIPYTLYSIIATDIDSDGDFDLFTTNSSNGSISLFINSGGSFTLSSTISVHDAPADIVAGDWDNDGDIDLAVPNHGSNNVSILLNGDQGQSVVSITPSQNALNVPADAHIEVQFFGAINFSSLNDSASFLVIGSQSGKHGGVFTHSNSTRFTFTPNTPFMKGEVVSLVASNKIKDTTNARISPFNSSFTVAVTGGSGNFSVSSISSPGSPYAVALADFDNDGDLDFASVQYNSNTLVIMKNTGNGNFTQTQALAVQTRPVCVVARDFDRDGYQDLAVTNTLDNTVSILLNNGTGTFTIFSTLSGFNRPASMVARDFDSDGNEDLAVTNYEGNTVAILHNNGTALFSIASTIDVGDIPFTITSGDFDNDGDIDLATANRTTNNVSVLINNGSGIFTRTASINAGTGTISLVAGDFDNDGDVDIVTANDYSSNITILTNDGIGNFAAITSDSIGSGPTSINAGDFDHDGDLDIAVANWNGGNVTILNNYGSGAFTIHSFVQVDVNPYLFGVGDVDADGDLDLIVPNYWSNSISVLKNNGTVISGEAPVIIFVKDVPNDEGGKVTIKWQASSLDVDVNTLPFYSIWRALPEGKTSTSPIILEKNITLNFKGPGRIEKIVNGMSYSWEWIANQPTHKYETYSYSAPTLFDSTSQNNGKHYFLVSAHTPNPDVFYDSDPDSGYSLDNLSPEAPKNLKGVVQSGAVLLHWDMNVEPDVHTYIVYRSNIPNSNPDSLTPVGLSTDTTFTDRNAPQTGNIYYFLRAQDVHGNFSSKSGEISLNPTGITGNEVPKEFALYQNYPNPFNPSTTISIDIAKQAIVTLKVYDVLGKEVMTLAQKNFPAGSFSVAFDASQLKSGVYFYRLTAVTEEGKILTLNKKMSLIK